MLICNSTQDGHIIKGDSSTFQGIFYEITWKTVSPNCVSVHFGLPRTGHCSSHDEIISKISELLKPFGLFHLKTDTSKDSNSKLVTVDVEFQRDVETPLSIYEQIEAARAIIIGA